MKVLMQNKISLIYISSPLLTRHFLFFYDKIWLTAFNSILSFVDGLSGSVFFFLRKEIFAKYFAKFTGKHLRQSLFIIKLQVSGYSSFPKLLWYHLFRQYD